MLTLGATAHAYDMMQHGLLLAQATTTTGLPVFDTDTVATINAGKWLNMLSDIIITVLGVAFTYLMTYVPFFLKPLAYNLRIDKLYTNAVYSALAKAKQMGDIKADGTMMVDVQNKYLDDVIEYVEKNADKALFDWGGDPALKAKSFMEKIISSTATSYKAPSEVKPTTTPTTASPVM